MNTTQQTSIIDRLIAHIELECSPVDREEAYERMLRDCYPETVNICGMDMDAVHVLKEMDSCAYDQGVNDYADGQPWVEVNCETYEQEKVDEAREEFVCELETEKSELEEEFRNVDDWLEPEQREAEEQEITAKITALDSQIDEVNAHSF